MNKKKKPRDSIYNDLNNEVNELIDNTINIEDLLILWKEEQYAEKLLEIRVTRIKNKIRAFLKERHWKRYNDTKTKISVTLSMMKRETVDMKQLKLMLNDGQLAQVTKINTSEIMRIITPETRKRLNNICKK